MRHTDIQFVNASENTQTLSSLFGPNSSSMRGHQDKYTSMTSRFDASFAEAPEITVFLSSSMNYVDIRCCKLKKKLICLIIHSGLVVKCFFFHPVPYFAN